MRTMVARLTGSDASSNDGVIRDSTVAGDNSRR